MAYDEGLAGRVRDGLETRVSFREIKMFGGLCFLVNGNMACGITADRLMVRVGKEQYKETLMRPFVRPMTFTGRPMRGIVYVEPQGIETETALHEWLDLALAYALSLPPKEASNNKNMHIERG
jgi:TfoX/Sxy family transcriptional regulator of competence genes